MIHASRSSVLFFLLAGAIALVAGGGVADELVLCTTKDGKTHAADTPPPGCVVTKQPAAPPAAKEESPSRAVEVSAEVDRRRLIQAITMQGVRNMPYASGRFIQGFVANGTNLTSPVT